MTLTYLSLGLGPEPGAVIIDSSCPAPKKQRLSRRVYAPHHGYVEELLGL
jgi:hypothetical protein